jgi:hypothetical protein
LDKLLNREEKKRQKKKGERHMGRPRWALALAARTQELAFDRWLDRAWPAARAVRIYNIY